MPSNIINVKSWKYLYAHPTILISVERARALFFVSKYLIYSTEFVTPCYNVAQVLRLGRCIAAHEIFVQQPTYQARKFAQYFSFVAFEY